MEQEGVELILFILIIAILGGFFVLLFLMFLKRKNKLIKSKQETENYLKQEIVNTQIEIREETLRNISWELHDNIGQLMTLAKIQVQNAKNDPKKIEEVAEIIGKSLSELRALSKAINPETIKNLNFVEAIQAEIDRFNRLKFLEATFIIKGEIINIDSKEAVILFRILQEFFSNTIKHSQSSTLHVEINYKKTEFNFIAKDNGIGFNTLDTSEGIGLKNMKNRAKLVRADLTINSIIGEGTTLIINYKY
ncbi:sensor histidine kinase [Lacinutrix salivirga]